MNTDERADIAAATTALAICGVGFLGYLMVARKERKKRAKIEEWKLENLACIENSRERLMGLIESPNFNVREVFDAMQEESRFLEIVRNQPKY